MMIHKKMVVVALCLCVASHVHAMDDKKTEIKDYLPLPGVSLQQLTQHAKEVYRYGAMTPEEREDNPVPTSPFNNPNRCPSPYVGEEDFEAYEKGLSAFKDLTELHLKIKNMKRIGDRSIQRNKKSIEKTYKEARVNLSGPALLFKQEDYLYKIQAGLREAMESALEDNKEKKAKDNLLLKKPNKMKKKK